MIDRDRLLRKMRKAKLENDITAYKMKRNEANICLKKAKSKYYQNLLDENFRSPDRFWKVNLSKLTQSLPQIQRSLHMALLTSIPRLFQN